MIDEIKKVGEFVWEIPVSYKKGMNVPARIYANQHVLKQMDQAVFKQITNVAALPGIQKYSFCMPDGHSGYGFPIGGVAAFDPEENGVISPGGIGFDVNCGMRLIRSNLTLDEIKPKLRELVDELFKQIPAGVGRGGFVKLNKAKLNEMVSRGAEWCVENGYGWEKDLVNIEEKGTIKNADPSKVSEKAVKRGLGQLGTLGSGNHYLEIQVVKDKNIFDKEIAKKLGLFDNQVVIMVHCGSRGFGHQIGTDYLKKFLEIMPKYNIEILDRELASAPFNSKEGQDYFKAMGCAANLAFANRQVILHRIRETFSKIFEQSAEDLELELVYDIAHNMAKLEEHKIDGKKKMLVVHRKGSTRCFGPSRMKGFFKETGQPVICGGSMETGSYLLVGLDGSEQTFGSTMHGSGRTMSRTQAKRLIRGDKLKEEMLGHGIYVKAVSMPGLAEEAAIAYKNIDEITEIVEKAGISKRVVALKPIGNIKG